MPITQYHLPFMAFATFLDGCFRFWPVLPPADPLLNATPEFLHTYAVCWTTMAEQLNNLNLDDKTKKELSTFLEQEQSRSRVQSSIHNFTSLCWDKCITGTPSTSFSRGEESCLANCVDRFLDTSLHIVNEIEKRRLQSGA